LSTFKVKNVYVKVGGSQKRTKLCRRSFWMSPYVQQRGIGQWIAELARVSLSIGKLSENNKICTFSHLSITHFLILILFYKFFSWLESFWDDLCSWHVIRKTIRNLRILHNICLFSSSCLCPVAPVAWLSCVRWEKNQNKILFLWHASNISWLNLKAIKVIIWNECRRIFTIC
jgi:hypothetical protein